MVLATRRTASMKVRLIATLIAVFAFVVQPYVGLAFNHVANALNDNAVTLTPTTLVISGGQTRTSSGDAASYSNLSLTFHYTITNLESTDSLQYGWRTSGGVDQQLGSLNGQTNANGNPGADEVGSKTVSLPSDADIDGLTLYFKNNGDTTKPNSDTVTIANLTLQGQKVTTPIVPATAGPVENTRNHETFTTIEAALADSDTHDNDTLALNSNVTTTSFIKISRPITLNGNGHTITAASTVTSSVIDAWYTTGVTISNLTIDGNHVNIRGINVVNADATLNDVTVKNNGKDGVVVNASHVTVNNITTSGNAWDGVDVDKAGAVLTVNGTSSHTETGNAIYLDDTTTGAKVVDTNNQYFISHPNKENNNPNDRAYNLDRSNLVVNAMSPTNNAVVRTPNHKLVVSGTFTATENGANYLQTQLVYNGNSEGIVTTYGAVTNGTLAEFDTTGLPEGSGYYIALTGTDTLGNVSERKIINFTIDNTKPVAVFTSDTSNPTPNGYYNGDFQVGYSATDNVQLKGMNISLRDAHDTTSGNQWRANCYDNQTETTNSDIGTCTVKLPANLPDGEYFMQIGAQDAAGNWATVATRNVRIQRAVPVQPTNLQAKFQYDGTNVANDTYLNVTAKPNGNNLELVWNQPTDWVTGYHILATYPNDNTVHVGYQGPNANAWLIYNGFGQYGNGAYTYQVESVNPNGSTVSSEKFTLNYDSVDPVVGSITVTDAKGKVKDAEGANLRGNVTFYVSQAETNPNRLYVEYDQMDSSGKWQKRANSGWVYDKNVADLSVDTTQWADGEYQVKVSTDDKAWNHGGTTATFTVDNTPASVSFMSPTDFSKPFAVGPNVTVKASDVTSGLGVLVIHVYDSSNNAAKFCTASATELAAGELSCDLSALPSGTYHILVGVNDNAGNNTTVKSGDFVVDTERPNAMITTPSNNGVLQGNFTVTGTAIDNQTSVDHVNVYITKFNADGSRVGYVVDNQAAHYNATTKAFTYPVSGLADGSYTIKAVAFDQAGNSHFASTVSITVDNTPPILTINASNGTQVTGTTSNATDAVTVDGEAATVEKVANQNGSYNWSFTPVQAYKIGTTTVTVVSTDAAGNATKETANVVVAPAEIQQDAAKTSAPSGVITLADATNSGIQSFAVTPNNDNATITPTDSTDTAVLGTQTKKDTSNSVSDEAVLGTNDAKSSTWNIFGLAWYWWLLILAIIAAIIAWTVSAARRASDNSL